MCSQEPKGSCFFRAGKEMVFFENSVLLSDTRKKTKGWNKIPTLHFAQTFNEVYKVLKPKRVDN